MHKKTQPTQAKYNDPIVEELHRVREMLVEKYQGNLHTYSEAAKSHAMALGFKLATAKTQPDHIQKPIAV
jgi:hypothetical protein